MITAISLMRRRDDVPLNEFRRHWLDVHGPLVCMFPVLRHYVQCHVLGSPATNAAARSMRIDGFPLLAFANDEDRARAHACAAMAACNEDSKLFIGAVARIMAESDDIVAVNEQAGRARLIVLYPEGSDRASVAPHVDQLRAMPRLRGLRHYTVLQQGRAPNSVIPHLQTNAAAMAQAWFDSLVDLECAAVGIDTPGIASFACEEHRLV
jgi:EthD domain